jgi:peptidoglycan glycosyltransferase
VNRSIRRVGYGLILLILVLVGQLTYLQVVDANKLANDPHNVRRLLDEYNRARGEILTADGQIVAQSLPSTGDFKYQRVYPQGPLFVQISGYQSFAGLVGNTGVEASYDNVMTGRDPNLRFSNLRDIVNGKLDTANVVLAATKSVQQVAHDALGNE